MKKYLSLIIFAFTLTHYKSCTLGAENSINVWIKGPFHSYNGCELARKEYDSVEGYSTTKCWVLPDTK